MRAFLRTLPRPQTLSLLLNQRNVTQVPVNAYTSGKQVSQSLRENAVISGPSSVKCAVLYNYEPFNTVTYVNDSDFEVIIADVMKSVYGGKGSISSSLTNILDLVSTSLCHSDFELPTINGQNAIIALRDAVNGVLMARNVSAAAKTDLCGLFCEVLWRAGALPQLEAFAPVAAAHGVANTPRIRKLFVELRIAYHCEPLLAREIMQLHRTLQLHLAAPPMGERQPSELAQVLLTSPSFFDVLTFSDRVANFASANPKSRLARQRLNLHIKYMRKRIGTFRNDAQLAASAERNTQTRREPYSSLISAAGLVPPPHAHSGSRTHPLSPARF